MRHQCTSCLVFVNKDLGDVGLGLLDARLPLEMPVAAGDWPLGALFKPIMQTLALGSLGHLPPCPRHNGLAL